VSKVKVKAEGKTKSDWIKKEGDKVELHEVEKLWITISQRYSALNSYHNKITANADRSNCYGYVTKGRDD
jgi:hypothetical protein